MAAWYSDPELCCSDRPSNPESKASRTGGGGGEVKPASSYFYKFSTHTLQNELNKISKPPSEGIFKQRDF